MIKPVSGHCNIDCGYCFYKKGHTCGSKMSNDTMCAVLDKLSVFLRGGYPLVFQGGEPLLAGRAFFENVFESLAAKNLHPQIFVQTNGTLLDEAYAKMFAENNVLIGVSLDGTEKNHSLYRSDFHAVMKGIDCLRKYNCEFNILTVVTNELCGCLPKVYEFYRRESFEYQQYIPCLAPKGSNPYLHLSEENYGKFLTDLYSLWRKTSKTEDMYTFDILKTLCSFSLGISRKSVAQEVYALCSSSWSQMAAYILAISLWKNSIDLEICKRTA